MRIFTICILAAAPLAASETITLKDGRTLVDISITDLAPTGLKVQHSTGSEIVPASNLPPGVYQKAFTQIKAQQKETAEAKAADAKAAAAKAEAEKRAVAAAEKARIEANAPKGVKLEVKSVHGGGSYFRYFLSLANYDGNDRGLLTIRYESQWRPEGVGSQEIAVRTTKGSSSAVFIDWHTGPPIRHGDEPGLRRFVWVYQCTSGKRYSGTSTIPNEIAGALEADTKMVNQHDKMP